jgi:hypothetical protein
MKKSSKQRNADKGRSLADQRTRGVLEWMSNRNQRGTVSAAAEAAHRGQQPRKHEKAAVSADKSRWEGSQGHLGRRINRACVTEDLGFSVTCTVHRQTEDTKGGEEQACCRGPGFFKELSV